MSREKIYSCGFTLVEMAVVLAIIGTITGSVLVAQSMIASARLQTVITDYNNYVTAANNFKLAYKALPGDFSNAVALWGQDSATCPTGGGTSGTCNGNGDGQINNSNSTGQVGESYLFWQHLYLANMFGQSLSNESGSMNSNDAVMDTNSPAGSMKGSVFTPLWLGTNGGSNCSTSDCFTGFYGNVILFGGRQVNNNSYARTVVYSSYLPISPVLSTSQAAAIDSKMDDGLPGTGSVRALQASSTLTPNCTTTNSASTALYNLSNTGANNPGLLYGLIFITGL